MHQAATMTMGLTISDVTGQRTVRASTVPRSYTIRELLHQLIPQLGLTRHDSEGRPLEYQARLDREGRHLHGAEIVGDALTDDDELVLLPNIDAGGSPLATGRGSHAAQTRLDAGD